MPWRCVAATVAAALFVAHAQADESFPYRARVICEELDVRSGPSDNYYPAMKLARGDLVEVYRHDPAGWHAIRPPSGSFSWVAAEFIRPTEGKLGQVVGERVVARVGSNFSEVRDVIQVRLDKGEVVEILDTVDQQTEDGPQSWCKIAPPPGEFRWVNGKFLMREKQQPSELTESDAARVKSDETAVAVLERRLASMQAELDAFKGTPSQGGWKSPGVRSASGNESNGSRVATLPAATIAITAGNIGSALDQLEIELSKIVATDTMLWDFRELTGRIEQALALAETTADRSRVRNLLARVERFDDIRQRYATVVAQRNALDRGGLTRGGNVGSGVLGIEDRDPTKRYDGAGRLAQVVSQKTGAPQFALIDENGDVLFYVSPAPGVNLRSYLGREVGVTGTLGYLPGQQVRHVTAKRVEELDSRRIR